MKILKLAAVSFLQMAIISLSLNALAHGNHRDDHHHGDHHHHHHSYKLVCGTQGTNYQPYDQNNDIFIGQRGFGYAQPEDCYSALRATGESQEPLVCNWNGVNFQAYHIYDNHAVGNPGYGFANVTDCNYAVKRAERNMMCSWNGKGFQPFNVNTNKVLGRVSVATLEECIQMIRH